MTRRHALPGLAGRLKILKLFSRERRTIGAPVVAPAPALVAQRA